MKKSILTVVTLVLTTLTINAQWDSTGNNITSGNIFLRATADDAGDLIFQNSSLSQLGRIWTRGNGESGLFLSSGDTVSDIYISETGFVGIGTTAPAAKLDVNGNISWGTSGARLNTNQGASIELRGTGVPFIDFSNDADTDYDMRMILVNDDLLRFTGGNTAFIGMVGIGTNNPDSELTVKGKIHCEEVQVDLQVPADYVFEKYYTGTSELKKEYTMPTLEEVETYTKENHHLPNIPSAAEIKEEGLHLKEMTNLLLQKVEELTLYTIEQEKRIKALEGQPTSEK